MWVAQCQDHYGAVLDQLTNTENYSLHVWHVTDKHDTSCETDSTRHRPSIIFNLSEVRTEAQLSRHNSYSLPNLSR